MAARLEALCLALIMCMCTAGSAANLSSQHGTTVQNVESGAGALQDVMPADRGSVQYVSHDKRRMPHGGPDASTPFSWTGRNIAAAVGIAVSAMVANAAGLGGGPLFVSILSTVVGMDMRLVPGMSHTIITSGAVASLAFGLARRSPVNADKPLLNFDIALALVPAMLFGASFGVLVAPMVPEWLQTALLAALLAFVVRRTLAKGMAQLRKEREGLFTSSAPAPTPAARRSAWAGSAQGSVQEPLLGGSIGHRASLEGRTAADAAMSAAESAAAASSDASTARAGFLQRMPWAKAAALLALWAAFVVLQLLKSRHRHCTWAFAALAAAQAALLAGAAAAFACYQAVMAARDPESVDPQLQKLLTPPSGGGSGGGAAGSSRSDRGALVDAAAAVAAAGFIAGFLGLGGAVVFNPLLLEAGVHPQTVAATSMLIVLFGSSSIMLTFMFHHSLNLSYAAAFAPVAFCSSLLGVTILSWAIRKSGRTSIVILLTAGVIAIGAAATIVFGGLQAWQDLQHGDHGFRSFCTA